MSTTVAVYVLAALGAVGLTGAVFYLLGRRSERRLTEAAGRSAAQLAERSKTDALRDADAAKAAAFLAGKEEVMQSRENWERDE